MAVAELEKCERNGLAPHDAWNVTSVYLIRAGQAHARYVVVDRFVTSVKEGNFSAPVRAVLSQLKFKGQHPISYEAGE